MWESKLEPIVLDPPPGRGTARVGFGYRASRHTALALTHPPSMKPTLGLRLASLIPTWHCEQTP